MIEIRYGGKQGRTYGLDVSEHLLAVRTFERQPVLSSDPSEMASLTERSRALLQNFSLEWRARSAGVDVLRTEGAGLRDEARFALKEEGSVRFAGRVLVDPASDSPVLYTENLFVKFDGDEDPARCQSILADFHLEIKRPLTYTRNGYFAGAKEGTGLDVFDIALSLLRVPEVELCHPELIRDMRERAAFPQQWHLGRTQIGANVVDAHAAVTSAWALSMGEGVTIAIIDTGIDTDHEEFRGAGKIVAPRDATLGNSDPRPGSGENHGTSCAGVACANGNFGASGVAPRAKLMPIRLQSQLGSQQEADAFEWAASNGADVISNSWGPVDGKWFDPTDPRHQAVVPLPDSTRLAIEFAITHGRNGKGCVVTWAAGNGNESVDNDGYASYEKVIAVAACNDGGKKSAYSDFGKAVWCAFPSNDGNTSLTPGIWTTDISGKRGYNPGQIAKGDAAGNYTNSFGGTSSACPGVAGTAALILARNPDLRWDEVKDILRRSSDRIDAANGAYDASGHSPMYGYGRVNARKAVELAAPAASATTTHVVRSVQPQAAIVDLQSTKAVLDVPDTTPILAIRVKLDIEHTYVGDLEVTLEPPPALQVAPIKLHVREGGATANIKKTYDAVSQPALGALAGKPANGQWTLTVSDEAAQDEGVLHSFALELDF